MNFFIVIFYLGASCFLFIWGIKLFCGLPVKVRIGMSLVAFVAIWIKSSFLVACGTVAIIAFLFSIGGDSGDDDMPPILWS